MSAWLWQSARTIAGGYKDMLLAPASREWLGWMLPFAAAGLWHHRRARKDAGLAEGLAYVFPPATYLSDSFLADLLSIAVKFLVFRFAFKLILKFPFENQTFIELTDRLLGGWVRVPATPRSGPAVDALYSLALFLAFEFGWYAAHRATHEVPLLWAFHKIHHSATLLNPLASKRVHVLDDALLIAAIGAASGLVHCAFKAFGCAPSEMILYEGIPAFAAAFLVFGALRHSHIPLSFGPLDAVFTSPFMHQVHHSYKREHVNKNFGYHLTLFDWMFSTLHRPRPGEELAFGLSASSAERPPQGFLRMYFVQPLADCREYFREGAIFSFRAGP